MIGENYIAIYFLFTFRFYSFSWKIIVRRIFVNIAVLCLLVASSYAVVVVVER